MPFSSAAVCASNLYFRSARSGRAAVADHGGLTVQCLDGLPSALLTHVADPQRPYHRAVWPALSRLDVLDSLALTRVSSVDTEITDMAARGDAQVVRAC